MESRMFQLYELRDELPKAIENLNRLIDAEGYMVSVLKDSDRFEEIKDLVNHFEQDLPNYANQKIILEHRQEVLNELIADYEKQDEKAHIIDDAITRAFEAIGMSYTTGDTDEEE